VWTITTMYTCKICGAIAVSSIDGLRIETVAAIVLRLMEAYIRLVNCWPAMVIARLKVLGRHNIRCIWTTVINKG